MGFVWCPFCKNPHLLSERTCPITGQAMPASTSVPTKNKTRQSVQIGALIEGKYLLKTLLGSGAYGIVYAAENVTLGGQVALKFLGKQTKDAALRFEQEARIANSLQHPNICRVFDCGSTKGGTPFFVMEHLTGVTLRRRMKRGPMDHHEATGIISQVLSGLGAAHTKGVIHRDVKPENVFLEEREGLEPIAKVLDFGLAKLAGNQPTRISTVSGVALGTTLYMSPEQVKGLPVGVQCDVFAAAVVLYEAITGGHPFRGESHADTTTRILRDRPAPLSEEHGCGTAFSDVVAKALEKDPAARFTSAREFQAALHKALEIVERQSPVSAGIPNLAWHDSDMDSDEATRTVPNAIYRKP